MELARFIIPLLMLLLICPEAIREDIKSGKISNRLCAAGALFGISAAVTTGGASKLVENLFGFLLGILILILPFSARMVGGGDVKFLGCIGSILGWKLLLPSFFAGAAIGGAIGIILILLNERSVEKIRCRVVLARAGVLRTQLDHRQNVISESSPSNMSFFIHDTRRSNPEFLPYSIPLSAGAILVSCIHLIKLLK